MRAVAYIRVSKEREDGYSPDTQLAKIRSYCEAHGLHIVEVFRDLDESGRIYDRPAFQSMLRRISEGDITRVVVWRLDRFSRDTADFMQTLKYMRENGCEIASVNESFDTATPMGRAMVGILAVFAQLESETIGERIKDNLIQAVKQKKIHLGAHPPYGYSRHKGRLTVHPEQAEIVRWIFGRYIAGDGVRYIAVQLTERGVPAPRGGAFWRYTAIRAILRNPAYIGKVKYNGEAYPGEHEPIITPEVWEEAQRQLRIRTGGPRKTGETSVLGGFLRCQQCGRRGNIKISYRPGVGARYYCTTRHQANTTACDNISLDAPSLERALVRLFLSHVDGDDWREELAAAKEAAEEKEKVSETDFLERRRERVKRALDRLFSDHYEHEIITREQFIEANERYLRELQMVEVQLEEARARQQAARVDQANMEEYLRHMDLLREWDNLSNQGRRLALGSLIDRIEWGKEGATIYTHYGAVVPLPYADVWRGVAFFEPPEQHTCGVCGRKFRTKGYLKRHREYAGH